MFDLIAGISASTFLLIFTVFSIICIVIGWIKIRFFDDSIGYPLPPLTRFSPYEIAALKDDRKGVIQTALFSLWYKGKLSITGKGQATAVIKRCNYDAENSAVSFDPIEETVYQFVPVSGQNPAYFLQSKSVHRALDTHLKAIRRILEIRHLKHEATSTSILTIRNLVLLSILGVGLTRLSLGLYYDKPSLFLVILLVFFTLVAFIFLKPTSTTRLGRRYLRELESTPPDKIDTTLKIAIFGISTHTHSSSSNPFELAFASSSAPSSTGSGDFNCCTGGCGGGESSSSDGGGGCGGCGGGGGD